MILYFTLMLILVLISALKFKDKQNDYVLMFFMFVLWFLASFREISIGNDTITYMRLYEYIQSTGNFTAWFGRYEIGYLILNKVVAFLGLDFRVFLLVVDAFIFYAYYQFIKKYSSNKLLSVFVFLSLGFWGQTVNVIRLQIAIALCILAYIKKEEQKKLMSVLFFALSIFFQRIAITYLIVLIVPKKITKKFYAISIVLLVFILYFWDDFMAIISSIIPYYGHYLLNSIYSDNQIHTASILGCAMKLLVFLISYYAYNCNKENLDDKTCQRVCMNINMIFISFMVMIFSLKFNLLDRCAEFYWTFSILLLPECISLFKSKVNKFAVFLIVLCMCILYFFATNILRPEWNHIYPYVSEFHRFLD